MKILYIGKQDVLMERLKLYLPEMIIDCREEFWEGIELVQSGIYCVMIFNICGCPGWTLELARLRRNSDIPIAILTDRYKLDEKMSAFAFGANDYMTNINDIIALSSRIAKYKHALCESENNEKDNNIKKFTIDVCGEKLYYDGEHIRLTPKEFALFYVLLSHQGNALSHSQIGEHLYGRGYDLKSKKVMSNVFALRNKVEEDFQSPEHVHTISGEGYMLNIEDKFLFV